MFDAVKKLFSRPSVDAAAQLPSIATPKVKPGSSTYPSYLTTTKPSTAVLQQEDRRLASKDITTYRTGTETRTIIRDFVAASPDLSAAVWAYVRLGIPDKFHVVARNMDGTFNRDATQLAQQLITRFDLLPDYITDGFTGPQSIRAVSESLARELIMYGSCSGEIVLDKARMPKRIQPISTTQIKFVADAASKTLVPWQYISDLKIQLDIPTFVYVTLDQSLLNPYSESPIESAIKPAIQSEQFSADINRIISKVIHPRQKVKIDEEALRKHLSPEAQVDENVANAELNAIISSIESKINGLRPEDALVFLSSLDFVIENSSNSGLSSEYEVLQNIANARMSTGSKTNGTVLGFASGSSNIASSEILLFMKSATGAVKTPLEEFWSRVFTLSTRLFGLDVVVEFRYNAIDLRPEAELLAFQQTKQMIILEQLSLGLISDEVASLQLTGKLPDPGMKPLSGTGFRTNANPSVNEQKVDQATNPSNSGSTLNQNLNSDHPSTGRGQNKKAEDDTPVPQVVAPNITMNIDNTQTTASVLRMRRDEDGSLIVEKVAQ